MAYLVTVSILWAFSFGLIKGKLTGLDPNALAFFRLAISFVVFLPFLKIKNLPLRVIAELGALGAIQYGAMYTLYISSYQYLEAHEVALFTIFTPLFVILFHHGFSARYPRTFWLGTLLSVLGAAIIVFQHAALDSIFYGILMLQGANASFALGQVWYRNRIKEWPVQTHQNLFAFLYAGGVLFTGLVTWIQNGWTGFTPTDGQWIVILYLGLIPSGLCFFLWNKGATQTSAGLLAVMNNLKVPLAVLVSVLFFAAPMNPIRFFLGAGCIGIAIFIVENARFKRPLSSP
jgi:drug/metabolite transporter (DMT)-like permease